MSVKKVFNSLLIVSIAIAFLPTYSMSTQAADFEVDGFMNHFYGSAIQGSITKGDKEEIIKEKLGDRKISPASIKKASKMIVQARDNYDPTTLVFMKDGKLQSFLVDPASDTSLQNFDESDLLKHELALIGLMESGLDPQLNYTYETAVWTVDGDGGVRPDDFDWNAGAPEDGDHWYYEAANVRQMWAAQDCDTAGVNCGGDSSVIVAVVDTGLAFETRTNFDGKEFAQNDDMFGVSNINLYVNSDETANDNDDDDGNGYLDDRNGFNAQKYVECHPFNAPLACSGAELAEEGHPNDDQGHGTFVTSMITSLVDNASGSVGVASNVSIMPIKANNPNEGVFTTASLWWALEYAKDSGADIINMSLAGFGDFPEEDPPKYYLRTKIEEITNAGIVVVAAAGNFTTGIPMYPSAYPSVIGVGSVTLESGTGTPVRASYSNYGNHIDLVAYVGDDESGRSAYQKTIACFFEQPRCDANDDLTIFSNGNADGTSFAAPQVAAAVAILLSRDSNLDTNGIINALKRSTVDTYGIGFDNDTGNGVLDYHDVYLSALGGSVGYWKGSYRPPLVNGDSSDTYYKADFTGDGLDDILIATSRLNLNGIPGDNDLAWYLMRSNGTGFLDAGRINDSYGLAEDSFYVADFDGDSKDDILTATIRLDLNGIPDDDVAWYLMRSNGIAFIDGGRINDSYGVVSDNYFIADFDGSGKEDALISTTRLDLNGNPGDDDLAWYLMRSNGSTFIDGGRINTSYGLDEDEYYVADIDGNGRDDMLISTDRLNLNGIPGDNDLAWYSMRSNGNTFLDGGRINDSYGLGEDMYFSADFDNDNDDDIIVATSRLNLNGIAGDNDLAWYLMNSNGNNFIEGGMLSSSLGKSSDMIIVGKYLSKATGGNDLAIAEANGPSSWGWKIYASQLF